MTLSAASYGHVPVAPTSQKSAQEILTSQFTAIAAQPIFQGRERRGLATSRGLTYVRDRERNSGSHRRKKRLRWARRMREWHAVFLNGSKRLETEQSRVQTGLCWATSWVPRSLLLWPEEPEPAPDLDPQLEPRHGKYKCARCATYKCSLTCSRAHRGTHDNRPQPSNASKSFIRSKATADSGKDGEPWVNHSLLTKLFKQYSEVLKELRVVVDLHFPAIGAAWRSAV
ncbi:hypothetical protein PGQ11_006124 [Apiospora arundinis]|uniref:HIT-type domain-containing protein n=1 Tax=Apiospora arundinis TaxID=335852 RepID=A0ABR2IRT6_9PEZI